MPIWTQGSNIDKGKEKMSDVIVAPLAGREAKPHSFFVDLMIRLVKEKPLGTVGGIIVLIFLLVGIFANFLAPYGFNQTFVFPRLNPPSAGCILGADNLGRDLLSRVIYGARVSMYVGLGAASISMVLGTIIGMVSGFFGGKTDLILQRFVDAFMCIPALFLILTIMAIVGPGMWQVVIVLGLLGSIGSSRVIRGAVMGIKMNIYVEAARSIGCPTWRILVRHILPNVMAPIIVLFTVGMGAAIIAEASISFLGYGIPAPEPSWGGMLGESGRKYLLLAPWLALWSGLALAIVVYSINMLGDALRDLLDPRLRGGLGRYGAAKRKLPKV
jgi:peptide/nickel transport system permease protein